MLGFSACKTGAFCLLSLGCYEATVACADFAQLKGPDMELSSRPKHDRYTRPGEYEEIEGRLRANPANADVPVVVCYAFDYRTRLGPFLFADMRLLTAGPRAIAAALVKAGFKKTRIVLRQWNRNFRTSEARLDGVVPQLLF